jgi:hypothetical protein
MKYIKKFEKREFLAGWAYRSTSEEQLKIKKYFQEKYPSKVNILNKQGYINPTTLDITLKFAIRRKDKELIDMILNLKDKFENIDVDILNKKYNI